MVGLVGVTDPHSSSLPGLALCRGCQCWWAGLGLELLLGRDRFRSKWLWPLELWIYCWPAGGWGWFLTWLAAGSMVLKAGVDLLVSGTGSWASWLWDPRCLRAGIGLLVGGALQRHVLGLVSACWWGQGLRPRASQS